MRFLSSSAFARAPKLRFAANCSAAETMAHRSGKRPPTIWGSGRRFARLVLLRCQNRDRAAGLLDRRDRRLGSTPDRELNLGLQLAHAEQAHAVLGAAQHAGLDQRLRVHRCRDVELLGVDRLLNAVEIDLVELQPEWLVEAALRQAPMQRHLTALEALDAHARARRLALAAAAASLADARADAAADPHALLVRAGVVGDLVELHDVVLKILFCSRGAIALIAAISLIAATVTCRRPRGRDAALSRSCRASPACRATPARAKSCSARARSGSRAANDGAAAGCR